jgi:peroxiredoxin
LPSTIEQLHREFRDKGLLVWAIDIREPRDRVAQWVKDKGVTSTVLLDTDGSVSGAYRVTGTPTVVLIDRAGRQVARAVGMRPWTGDKGRALVAALLGRPK